MPDRLTIANESLFPVQAFFNAVGDESFVRVVESLTNGVGYSINECDCSFTEDLDPDEEEFDGVRFSLFEQSVVISKEELAEYVRHVCRDFVERFPAEEEEVIGILSRL